MEGALFLDVVIRKCPTIFQLLSGEDQALLIGGNTFLVLDLCLHVIDCIACLHVESDGFSSECLHKDLHTSPQTQHKMEGALFLDVVIRKRPTIFQLFSSEDQTLLIRGDALLILNLGLHVIDCITGFHIKRNSFSCECLHKDLHASPQTQHQMQSALFLDVVIRKRPTIFQLLASEDQTLLIRGNAFLVLDLGLHVINGITGLHVKRDGFSCECLHEDLHASPETQDQMESAFFLDVVIRKRSTIF